MKNFNFSLEKILNYKNQMLDSLKNELHSIQNELDEIDKKLSECNAMYKLTNENLLDAYQNNITANEITSYKLYLYEIDRMIKIYEEKSAQIKEKISKKQKEIVNAKIEVSTIEKLKEKEMMQYKEALKKENEIYIEEFVNNSK